ncbi:MULTISPECIES: hypothetical protein [Bradyrhizobium]|uniref:Uncharacterized protein n=1 Tax=Bradyrhizobium arachidis TaxID=858423 RepID=A0AAE7TGM6_9BRAD|nr:MULTISPECIES: hypothetical protein [Bradyrhizobium]QOG22154.1 hypothetical protein FOM02_37515 [Bradyrhizobium sp. SEMIA]QOZ66926.1 hypothetical protein WN72_11845 [Bradyrhizobium arachidis]UFW51630.1 hypothetical protein BaraCB756_11925 [Bradyrhizobium arachidis]SFV13777.1 hypothetical protein SAMN05192541_120111 [Bradyrhizobium arachidis]
MRLLLTVRLLATCACFLAGGWGVFFLIHPDRETRLNGFATRILASDRFDRLEALLPELKTAELRVPCNPIELRSDVIIRTRLYEEAVAAADPKRADQQLMGAREALDETIACAPTEGFLWFIRYWIRINQGAPAGPELASLAMSYRLAPVEGWIAVRRNVYSLAVYELLAEDQKRAVRAEFATLVNSGLLATAVRNVLGAGWPIRDKLLSELEWTDPTMRYQFARMARAEGADLAVPGVKLRDPLGRQQ